MTRRRLTAHLAALTIATLAAVPANGQAPPRTPWGAPDLQGVWDFRTITPMERPRDLADQEFLTAEEAASRNQAAEARAVDLASRPSRRTQVDPSGNVDRGEDGAPGSYNNFWFDRGLSVISTNRTSLVTDPPDGRIPPLTPDAQGRRDALAEARKDTGPHEPTPGGWVEDLGLNGLQAGERLVALAEAVLTGQHAPDKQPALL